MSQAEATSRSDMLEVNAAIARSVKKRVPKITPPMGSGGMDPSSEVSTTKTMPGPPVPGSRPAENSVGKMMSPAMMAMRVSKPVTHAAELTRSSFLEM